VYSLAIMNVPAQTVPDVSPIRPVTHYDGHTYCLASNAALVCPVK